MKEVAVTHVCDICGRSPVRKVTIRFAEPPPWSADQKAWVVELCDTHLRALKPATDRGRRRRPMRATPHVED